MAEHAHEFPTAVRLLDVDTLTELVDLHDPTAGYLIGDEVVLPAPNRRQGRLKSARVHGSFPVGARLADDGTLIVPISVQGSTWAEVETRYEALYAVLTSADEFYIEVALSGVTRRWYTDAPVDVLPEPITGAVRKLLSIDYELRFLVQPNPSVVIA